jgi:tetratricopeptide (TPR) repeat protein
MYLETTKIEPLNTRLIVFICTLLVLTTCVVFWQVRNHDFTNFDDDRYITANQHVQAGVTREGILWAFSVNPDHASFWVPLTWLSFMLDFELYGLNPGGYHCTNLLLHLANIVLLFLVVNRMTGEVWKSAFVAALFALHPLHVESVAWVTERKDVLSTLFWMLTVLAYINYAAHPCFRSYLPITVTFALGLMAKPMVVTLPFVLLLLDYWPLERFQPHLWLSSNHSPRSKSYSASERGMSILRLVLEKTPLFVLAAIVSVMTFLAQQSSGAAKSMAQYPLTDRIANAVVSYVRYIGKMIWPENLAAFYPHPGNSLPVWHITGAALLLISVSLVVMRSARRHPYFLVGWLWYLGTLVPVIGLVQSGDQAMADRFTYVPLIGLFIMITWGASELVKTWRHRGIILAVVASTVLLIFAICSALQVRYWKNDITLFTHALEVTDNNSLAHHNLGSALAIQGRYEEAIAHFVETLRISPNDAGTHYSLALALAKQGRLNEAIAHYSDALRIKPDYPEALNGLGVAFARQGRLKNAVAQFTAALQVNPDYAPARGNLDLALQIIAKEVAPPGKQQSSGP